MPRACSPRGPEGWGLFDPHAAEALASLLPDGPDPEARRARAHIAAALRRAKQFHRAIDQSNAPPPGLEPFLWKALRQCGSPEVVVTDRYRSYGGAE